MKKDKTERTKQSWRKAQNAPSLSEVNNSVAIPKNAKFSRKLFAFMGPGALIAVGYVDPGTGQLLLPVGQSLATRYYQLF